MALRLFGFVALLAALGIAGTIFAGRGGSGQLNPATEVDAATARSELASAQYDLAVVAAQLSQVKVLNGTYAGTLERDRFPLVTLVRADELAYCVEFRKTRTFFLAGPGGIVREGRC